MRTLLPQAAGLIVTLLAAAGCSPDAPQPVPAATPATNTAYSVDEDHHDHDDGPGPTSSAPPAPAAVDAATGYVQAWARPNLDQATWHAALQPLVLPAYTPLLGDTDPANVPATTLTGAPRVVSATTDAVVVDVPTDAGPIRVTVVADDGRWLVATADPVPEPS
ncbi:hypothetical protein [Actinoplanes flavus]|uniref:Lipoprotein n=1 Tax=Actinoplanes flavus TaxID=2820290 RepID=A0ABS3UCY5_9ACTN|nr:hypothetical protein [Actinoplanes flavus]MBO3736627.1 hypothetical protein [Actinoplanes flavus]